MEDVEEYCRRRLLNFRAMRDMPPPPLSPLPAATQGQKRLGEVSPADGNGVPGNAKVAKLSEVQDATGGALHEQPLAALPLEENVEGGPALQDTDVPVLADRAEVKTQAIPVVPPAAAVEVDALASLRAGTVAPPVAASDVAPVQNAASILPGTVSSGVGVSGAGSSATPVVARLMQCILNSMSLLNAFHFLAVSLSGYRKMTRNFARTFLRPFLFLS